MYLDGGLPKYADPPQKADPYEAEPPPHKADPPITFQALRLREVKK